MDLWLHSIITRNQWNFNGFQFSQISPFDLNDRTHWHTYLIHRGVRPGAIFVVSLSFGNIWSYRQDITSNENGASEQFKVINIDRLIQLMLYLYTISIYSNLHSNKFDLLLLVVQCALSCSLKLSLNQTSGVSLTSPKQFSFISWPLRLHTGPPGYKPTETKKQHLLINIMAYLWHSHSL